MKKALAVIAIVLCFSLFFSGCSVLLEREYRSVSPHLEQREEAADGAYLTAGSYTQLKEAIISLIRQGEEEGVIRVDYSYSGSLTRDLPQAIYEVMQEESLGAYAVEYIPYEVPVRYLNYYEVQLTISYRISQEKLLSIPLVQSIGDLSDLLEKALGEQASEIVVECSYFSETLYDVPHLMEKAFLACPETAIYLPTYTMKTYPDSGYARVLEIQMEYPCDSDQLQEYCQELDQAATECMETIGDLEGVDWLRAVSEWARSAVVPEAVREDVEQEALLSSAYGPLLLGKGTARGLALMGQLLCQLQGMESIIAEGTREEETYYWNMVNLDGQWYHWDLYELLWPDGNVLLCGEDHMNQYCSWMEGSIPSTSAEIIYLNDPAA